MEEYAKEAQRIRLRRFQDASADSNSRQDARARGSLADEVMDALGIFYDYHWEEVT
jgi:hypothetical protein